MGYRGTSVNFWKESNQKRKKEKTYLNKVYDTETNTCISWTPQSRSAELALNKESSSD